MAYLHLLPWTDQRRLADQEFKGRAARTLAGSHVADLVHLRKSVILCSNCQPKFNAKANGYISPKNVPLCGARCDGCKDMGMERRLFLHHQHLPR